MKVEPVVRLLLLSVGVLAAQCRASDPLPTIVAGLRAREDSIRSLSGQVLVRSYTSPALRAEFGKPSAHEGVERQAVDVERGLYAVEFWLDNGRFRLDVTTYRAGLSRLADSAPGVLPGAEKAWWPASALTRHLHDGRRAITYTSLDCTARLEAQEAFLPAYRWPPLCESLLLGRPGASYGELLSYLHARESAATPPAGKATPPSRVRVGRLGSVTALGDPSADEVAMRTACLPAVQEGAQSRLRVLAVQERKAEVVTTVLSIAPEWGYAVTRAYVVTDRHDGAVEECLWDGMDYRETAPGVWLPGLSRLAITFRNRPEMILLTEYQWSAMALNEQFPDAVFAPAMPTGTLILEVGAERSVGPVGRGAWNQFNRVTPDWKAISSVMESLRQAKPGGVER